tara:strand:+ start:43 stop:486 length:444 start_codon:yes stop_codon:yes gene_type:complete
MVKKYGQNDDENRKDFLQKIKNQNGDCICPNLTELFKTKRKAEGLEGKCYLFKNNVDIENPSIEDKSFLQEYLKTVEKFESMVDQYNSQLFRGVENEILDLRVYRFKIDVKGTKITQKQAIYLFEEEASIITLDCRECGQQIDICKC